MSRSAGARPDDIDRRHLIAQLKEDLQIFRTAGPIEAARYCERLLAMIGDGAFDCVPDWAAPIETLSDSPETETDGRYGAGQRWFLNKLKPAASRRFR